MTSRTYRFTGILPHEFTLVDNGSNWMITPTVPRRTWYGRKRYKGVVSGLDGRTNTLTVNFR